MPTFSNRPLSRVLLQHVRDFVLVALALAEAIKAHVAILCLVFTFFGVADAYSFLAQPEDYIPVHHLNPGQPYWQWQYLRGSVIMVGICVAGFTLIILSYREWHSRLFQLASQIFTLTMITWLVTGFYQWYQCGFDHDY